MKVKVLTDFRDAETLKIHKKDSVIGVTKKRYDEIAKVEEAKKIKLVEVVKDEPKATGAEKAVKAAK